MLEFDEAIIEKHIINFIQDAVYKNKFEKGIIGVSGGIDSAVVLTLTQRALGSKNTHALLMPYKLSSRESIQHGQLICDQLQVQYEIIDISKQIDAYFEIQPTQDQLLIGNKCARERMSVLFDHSMRKNALVVGAANKSELLIGYSTLYGDNAAAFFPIGDLYKTQVFSLARYLSLPQEIINKKPSADLWKNQTDEEEIGISYRKLDEILYSLFDLRKRESEINEKAFSKETITRIKNLVMNSQFKRTMPPIAKIHPRTIGIDFRYMRDWNK